MHDPHHVDLLQAARAGLIFCAVWQRQQFMAKPWIASPVPAEEARSAQYCSSSSGLRMPCMPAFAP
jgi:hypothetical protein